MPPALWCKSHYSFLEGASSPGELVARAVELGLPALALTDRDGVPGVPSAWLAARGTALKLIIGSQVSIDDGTSITLLAADRRGYANLCGLVTAGAMRAPKGQGTVRWDEVAAHAEGLLALWGGRGSALIADDAPRTAMATLREAFGDRLHALAARHRHAPEQRAERRLRERAAQLGIEVVAAVEVLYHDRARRPLQDVLTCIREGTTVDEAGTRLQPNDRHALPSAAQMRHLFADDPAALAAASEAADRCAFDLADLRYRYPAEFLPFGMSEARWLDALVTKGARERFGQPVPADMAERIARELALIHELDYEGYFLTMAEIVRFCGEQGILCQGRGSAANSVVCYCLKVT
ncbi:MAG TPA: PHP domain-containing protein, partial [Candidatus Krumholzibacteria bacterium]|nr:PHP domain-containing protein [Candidatus Krumholzibacteria bacterium]